MQTKICFAIKNVLKLHNAKLHLKFNMVLMRKMQNLLLASKISGGEKLELQISVHGKN